MDVHGNRGLCAGPCRLPYTLLDDKNKIIDNGYLLSPRDLMGTYSLPELIKSGVNCFKIEGRLKNPEYVGIVTKYYRNMIDIVYNNLEKSNEEIKQLLINKEKKINPNTSMSYLEELKQSFNRGGFSNGHFSTNPNKELIYKDNSSNTGFYLGNVQNFNPNKGYITLKLEHNLGIGDKISINSNNYTISELIKNKSNIKFAKEGDIVTIGRIKGNIGKNQKIFKIQSKILNDYISPSFNENKEIKKIKLNATVNIKENQKISIEIFCNNTYSIYYGEQIKEFLDIIPEKAQKSPILKSSIISQISKTGNTQFEFEKIDINLDNELFINLKNINELRRNALNKLQETIIEKHINSKKLEFKENNNYYNFSNSISNKSISLLLTILDEKINYNYSLNELKSDNNHRVYIPLKYFFLDNYKDIINNLCNTFNVFTYLPNIIRNMNKFNFDYLVNNYNIEGFVISSISQIIIFKKYNLKLIGDYTLNVYNKNTIYTLNDLGLHSLCITPELNDYDTINLINNSTMPLELWAYGKIPLMTLNYCLLGHSNKCYKECEKYCNSNKKFYLKDRLGFKFRSLQDNYLNLTKIYNSKITSFDYSSYNTDYLRISILDESQEEIKQIIKNVKNNIPFKGNDYCVHFNK